MPDEMITPENLSKELLKSVLEAAYLDVSYDKDGDIRVKDKVTCFVFPNEKWKDRVTLCAIFGFKAHATPAQRLECANRINSEYAILRAVVGKNDTLRFTYDVLLEGGGISRKAFVLVLKRFCSIPHDAVRDCGEDLIE